MASVTVDFQQDWCRPVSSCWRPPMKLKCLLTAALSLALSTPLYAEPPAAEKGTFWIIPHTHWEGAVFKTREEYLKVGLPNILKALYLLKKYPDYRFVLDQVAYVKPFIE